MSRQFERTVTLSTDKEILALVDRVGQTLARTSTLQYPIVTRVIDSDEINVESFPGGYLYVTRGLIGAAASESELAAAMAHGIGRIAGEHKGIRIPATILQQAAALGMPIVGLNQSREQVREADRLGVQLLYRAGYDPGAAIDLLKKMEAQAKPMKGGQTPGASDTYLPLVTSDKVSKALATHPPIADRIKDLQKWSASNLPARNENIVTTAEFNRIHERISR